MSAADLVLAIDVGGTKLAAGLVDDAGRIVRSAQVPTPAADAAGIWVALSALVDDVATGTEPIGVGIGCGGPLRIATGEVSPLNIPGWRDFPLVGPMRERFPGVPIELHNDATAMAVGEHWRGAGSGASCLIGVVVSTGVGGGVVLDGRVVGGPTGNAAHIGHVVVEPDGPSCECGGRGCLEAIARGPAVVAAALANGWQPSGAVADGRSLVVDARRGDAAAIEAIRHAGDALGIALASAAHLFELDRAVIGGGLAVGAGDLLLDATRAAYSRHARMDFVAHCEIVASRLGNEAGLIGAAALVLEPGYLAAASAHS